MGLASIAREAWHTIRDTVDAFVRDDCVNLSAGLAFYTIFSLAPLVVVVLKVAGLFLSPERIEAQIVAQVASFVGDSGAQQVREILGAIDRQAEGGAIASVVSAGATLFAATTVLAQLQTALNRAWGVKPKPGADVAVFLRKRLLSLGIVLTIALLVVVSLFASAIVRAWSRWLVDVVPSAFDGVTVELVDIGVSWTVLGLLFAAMYRVLPDAQIRWRDVGVGAAVTSALFVLGKEAISLYLGQTAFGSSYGAAGSLAVVLAWVFYSSALLLLGAEFTHVWAERCGQGTVPEPEAELDQHQDHVHA